MPKEEHTANLLSPPSILIYMEIKQMRSSNIIPNAENNFTFQLRESSLKYDVIFRIWYYLQRFAFTFFVKRTGFVSKNHV